MSQLSMGLAKRSVYHGWLPPSNEMYEDIISTIIGCRPRTLDHHEYVKEFRAALGDDQIALFNDALIQVRDYYRKVWLSGCAKKLTNRFHFL